MENLKIQEEAASEMLIPVEVGSDQKEMENAAADVSASEKKSETLNLTATYLDQLQRLKAEFDNYRKRIEKEKEDFNALTKGRVILNLLPVLDDLDRLFQYSKGQDEHLATGIELICQKMKAILLNEGLQEINPVGGLFDPLLHEALGVIDAGPEKDGLVMEELVRGYLLQGKLLRASRVRVGRYKQN
jgi:molecular chaperone GrpE